MAKARDRIVQLHRTHSWSTRWDESGRCFKQVNDGPEERCSDLDFGTPNGDLIIDPWIQDIIRDTDDG